MSYFYPNSKKRRSSSLLSRDDERYTPPPGKTPKEDTASVMDFYGLRAGFPKFVRDEAKLLARTPDDVEEEIASGDRIDLRRKFIFTCDPVSARDYDDALSLDKDSLGRRVLGVHIADVSHYVQPGGALDREASKRSTSVYLADKVVPMLPEELSNGICSLVPGEDRLAFSVFITFNRRGEAVKAKFAKSVIRSSERFTYEQVMGMIFQSQSDNAGEVDKRKMRTVREIHLLAQQLRRKRFEAGALDLETPEMRVLLDGGGEMTGLEAIPYDESHQMVEECMVAANEAVAKELSKHGIGIIARYHAKPDPDRLLELRREVQSMGIVCGNLENMNVFKQFMQTIKAHPAYSTLSLLVLRAMNRAVYDADSMGHWGLAKEYYAHFTSPIRRYPDLVLHRQLAAYLKTKKRGKTIAQPDRETLAKCAKHASEMEQRAVEAERSLLEIKKFRVLDSELQSGVKAEYDGIISKCERFGCFVDVPALAVSGLVHIGSLSPRFVRFNESDHTLSAGTNESWKVGDPIRVIATQVDFDRHRIVFVPVERLDEPVEDEDEASGREERRRHEEKQWREEAGEESYADKKRRAARKDASHHLKAAEPAKDFSATGDEPADKKQRHKKRKDR